MVSITYTDPASVLKIMDLIGTAGAMNSSDGLLLPGLARLIPKGTIIGIERGKVVALNGEPV